MGRKKYTLYMARIFTICCLLALPFFSVAQTDPERLLQRAKAEMKGLQNGDQPDYIAAGKWLEDVVKALPNNAEAWYYYGCAIDRYNHKDGESITTTDIALTENTSLAFENSLQVSNDKYTGDILLLDPHTKILSAWGAQALYYAYNNDRDSAEWCLKQALQRGGINKTVATYFKQVMDECQRGAYLFTTGDMYTYYLLYLQLYEHYRTDIICVDLNLLNTSWYPDWLQQKNPGLFSYAINELDRVKRLHWDTKEISIPNKNGGTPEAALVWELKPTKDNSLPRSDQLLLDMLQVNAFTKPVYFAGDVPSDMKLFLDDYLQSKGLTHKLLPEAGTVNETEMSLRLKKLPVLPSATNYLNSRDNIQVLNNYRFAYTTAAIIASQKGHNDEALQLIETAERKYPENLLPFFADATRQWFVNLKEKAQKGDKL
jgi:tetratricopeptide (TPR) repeat protein